MRRKQDYVRTWNPGSLGDVVLWLPLYKYGKEATKIWDRSGYNNHGTLTGAVPATEPILGSNIIVNGTFDSDTTGWTGGNATLASVAGGIKSSNCLEITRVEGDYQVAVQTRSLKAGKNYLVRLHVKSGTSGNETWGFYSNDHGALVMSGVTNPQWTFAEHIWTATVQDEADSSFYLMKNSATPGTMLFDQVEVYEVIGYDSLGWFFDGEDDTVQSTNVFRYPTIGVTVTFWVKMKDWLVWANNYTRVLSIGKIGTYSLELADTHGGVSDNTWAIYPTDALWSDTSIPVDRNGRWRCYALVMDSANNKYHVYSDGVLGYTAAQTADVEYNDTLTVSLAKCTAEAVYTRCVFGEVVIFNTVKTAQDIRSYYEKTRHIFGV